jgi:hypothetical protein
MIPAVILQGHVIVHCEDEPSISGLIYFPLPETKPEHFQKPGALKAPVENTRIES